LVENVFWVPKEARWSHLQDYIRLALNKMMLGEPFEEKMLRLSAL